MRSLGAQLLVMVLLAAPVWARADDNQVLVAGPKSSSCGSLLQSGNSDRWNMWILGFWSGMNWEASGRSKGVTGSTTDDNGIIASVKKRCMDDPALSVAFVTAGLHRDFEKDGR